MKKVYIGTVLVLLILLVPVMVWFLDDGENLRVAIIDKTVPDESYREHAGVSWLLNYLKYEHNGSLYDKKRDYYGFSPNDSGSSHKLPNDYNDYDIIYLADTYGVYKDDRKATSEKHGTRSKKVYGGLEPKDWEAMAHRLASNEKSLLIAEFNTFASPTSAKVRDNITDYLGLEWKGWTGRYFNDLSLDSEELPQWIKEEYRKNWPYKGGGFLLLNDFTSDVQVLELGEHVSKKGIRLKYTKAGEKQFGLTESPDYHYWFDIVTPKNGSVSLADYSWALTDKGQNKLEDLGIPEQFAAVVKRKNEQTTSYYFAGDYNDINELPPFYQMKGLAALYQMVNKRGESAFYWAAYMPMMQTILSEYKEMKSIAPKKEKGLQYISRLREDKLEVKINGEWQPMTIKGVNIGMGKPGAFPGEAAITEEEYYRWMKSIADMNANMIRVYTIHPPGFYNALKRFNESSDKKLYVMHGSWIEEEGLEKTLDAYDKETLKGFRYEMKTIADIIHGNAVLKHRPGHASGVYRADVSEYVVGWIIGIEWYPLAVAGTNEKHTDLGEYDGRFFTTKGASPFEHWLAEQMDYLLSYEYETYGWIRPMSFTNWVTTDLLDHPSEPHDQEDLVSVNPNVIYTKKEAKETGQFASYHVYPYYPDFLNYDKRLLNFTDHRGRKNSYAGYLADLHRAHRLPVLIAEFGIPASRGLTHENPYGWNQGLMDEKKQGEIVASLYEDIQAEKLMGGLVFTWQDEWFKRTWNTVDYDNPNRRPYWSSAQTNEQQFGLLSFDRHKIKVDSNTDDWKKKPLNKGDTTLAVDYDERYLYLKIEGERLKAATPHIAFDVIDGQGNKKMNLLPGITFEQGIDFVAKVSRDESQSRIMIDPYYDMFTYLYSQKVKILDPLPSIPRNNSGLFQPIKYMLNRELHIPETGEVLPVSSYETGKLKEGNGNPESDNYDSLADYSWKDDRLELRIPWLLLQARDPSQREFIGNLQKDGLEASVNVDAIGISVVFEEDKKIVGSIPEMKNGQISFLPYTWKKWDKPKYTERLKESYFIMKEAYGKVE